MTELSNGPHPDISDQIDRSAPEPLYHQVFLLLQDRINAGAYADGERFPTENELIAMLNVSRITIRRALQELSSRGLIVRERALGTRVVNPRTVTRLVAGVEGMLENNRRLGRSTTVRLLRFEYVQPPLDVAKLLEVNETDEVQRTERVRSIEDIPFSYAVTFVPEQIGRTYSREEIAKEPLLHLLERSGVRVSHARQTISAQAASIPVARALLIGAGAPLLRTVRTVFDESNRPVEHIEVLYRPEYFAYEIELERTGVTRDRQWVASKIT
uniref:GntR family transcriptional regulator n=1 Tax=Roseovarius indicus TaxID=540747 RepID=UPI003B52B846